MSQAELLTSARTSNVKNYVSDWEKIMPEEDPLLASWKKHIEENKLKCKPKV